jgi:exonuclease VII small subunit
MSDSASFNNSYKVLKDTADWLSKQEEPDIDQLVPRVEEAMQAYHVCKERLEKVKETLGKYLQPESSASTPT